MFRSIVGNITMLFAVLTLGLVVGMAIIDGVMVGGHLVAISTVEMQALAREKQAAFSSWRRDLQAQADAMAHHPQLLHALAILHDERAAPDQTEGAARIASSWLASNMLVTDFVGYTLLDVPSGRILVSSGTTSPDPLSLGHGWTDQRLFRSALDKPVQEAVKLDPADDQPSMVFATPITFGPLPAPAPIDPLRHGPTSAVLLLYANFHVPLALTATRIDDPSGLQSYLLDQRGAFLTPLPGLSNADLLKRIDDEPAAKECLAGRSGVMTAPDYRNVDAIVAYRWMPNAELCLISSIRRDAAVSLAGQLEKYIFLASFCLFWVGCIVSMVFGRRVAAPVLAIAAAVRGVAEGQRGVRLPEKRRDELGDVARGFNQMVAALERRELELERSRTALSSTLSHIDQGLARFDGAMRLVFFNRRFPAIFGLDEAWLANEPSFQEIVARCYASGTITILDNDRLRQWLAQLAKQPDKAIGTLRLGDGRAIEMRHDMVPEGGMVLSFSDVTVLHRQQEELRAARDGAERANRAKSDFLAAMSHELRTPLNAILGFSQLLQIDKFGELNPRQAEFVQLVIQSGEHLLGLISDMLELSKIEAGRINVTIEQIDPAAVIKSVRTTLEAMAMQRKVRILPGDDGVGAPLVLADRKRLMQVLANLGTNAIKYNRQNGTVAFEVTHRPGEWVRISVIDTGMGIPTERQGELFKPFSRLGAEQSTVEGTGIGLNITRQLVDLMGGKLGFSSTPGFGSRFWVELLPAPAEVAAAAAKAITAARGKLLQPAGQTDAPAAEPAERYEVTVLYVEDNPVSRELMRNVMEFMSDAHLLEAESGAKALDMARARRPDLVVLDIELPDMDGYTVLRRLHDDPATSGIPVVALTRNGFIEDTERLGDAQFRLYLTKPLQIPRLLEVVKGIAQEKAFTPA